MRTHCSDLRRHRRARADLERIGRKYGACSVQRRGADLGHYALKFSSRDSSRAAVLLSARAAAQSCIAAAQLSVRGARWCMAAPLLLARTAAWLSEVRQSLLQAAGFAPPATGGGRAEPSLRALRSVSLRRQARSPGRVRHPARTCAGTTATRRTPAASGTSAHKPFTKGGD